jgi:hypothetical protein
MSKRDLVNTNKTLLIAVDQLFGRDLRTDGWFVDEGLVARGRR